MAENAEIVKLFYEENKSPSLVRQRLMEIHPYIKAPSRKKIYRIVKKFECYGAVNDRRHENQGRPRSGRTEENITKVREIIEETPRKSVRGVLKDISNDTSMSSVYRILKFDLKLHPYKISVMQSLKDTDIGSRLAFARWMLTKEDVIDSVWFSDEAHFNLCGHVNKQNMRFWGSNKPDVYDERPLHSEKVTVWAAFSSKGVIGPFFYEEAGETATVTSDRYLRLLRTKFLPALTRRGETPETCWFQQDGAAPHTANVVLNWLTETFGENLISLKTDTKWPPHSPDLSPLDFFLWGYLKDKVYSPKPTTVFEMKHAIRREMKKISADTCHNVINSFRRRLQLVVQKRGGHLEHIL